MEHKKNGYKISLWGLLQLFLLVSFPINFWAFIIAMRDVEQVVNLTSQWDGIGGIAYTMMFSFAESLVVFLFWVILFFLLPKRWQIEKKVQTVGWLAFNVTVWGILKQVNFEMLSPAQKDHARGLIVVLLERTARPVAYGGIVLLCLFVIILLSVVLPIFLVNYPNKLQKTIRKVTDNVALLSSFYVGINILSMLIVLIRNL